MFKNCLKTIILSAIFSILIFFGTFAKAKEFYHSDNEISNYFFGSLLFGEKKSKEAIIYLNKAKGNALSHEEYNKKYIQTLVDLGKIEKAFLHLRKIKANRTDHFQFNLLLGLQAINNNNYFLAEKYFKKLNKSKDLSDLIEKNLGTLLLSWVKVAVKEEQKSYDLINSMPYEFKNIKLIQKFLIDCKLNSPDILSVSKILNNDSVDLSRYNFFLASYYLNKNNVFEAKKILVKAQSDNSRNLLINQTLEDLKLNKITKVKKLYNCQNLNHGISELFYVIANLYSSEKEYRKSNFYFRISNFFNPDFKPNIILLAQNLYELKQYDNALQEFLKLKKLGNQYNWYKVKNMANIIEIKKSLSDSVIFLENEVKLIKNPNYNIFYDLANFYRDNEQYEKSIEFYKKVLNLIDDNNVLTSRVYYKIGTCYESLGKYKFSEKNLKKSLSLLPDQPYVLNYLAYSWLERKINLKKSISMLEKANSLKENDPYIIDSLGWGMYLINEYDIAEQLLRKALELLPSEPVVNDHYGDVLWKMNRNIQARYIWQYALKQKDIDQKLKDNINKKIIFGLQE